MVAPARSLEFAGPIVDILEQLPVNRSQARQVIGRGDGDITRDDLDGTFSRSRTLDLLEYALVADAELVGLAVGSDRAKSSRPSFRTGSSQ
jgi:hypothetical protein